MLNFIADHTLNFFALFWFLLCFKGYTIYARRQAKRVECLASAMHQARYEWMYELLHREIRVADNTAIANLERGVSFFASTTMLILAGLMTILGSTEKALGLVADMPFVVQATRAEWEVKIVLLIFVFVYAFFKFTWSLRQYGFVSVMAGGAKVFPDELPEERRQKALQLAEMASMAANNFNMGLRTYYFSIAVLSWFVHPILFMLCSGAIVFILYRREFKSSTLKTLLKTSDRS